jgi:hypothetical protein
MFCRCLVDPFHGNLPQSIGMGMAGCLFVVCLVVGRLVLCGRGVQTAASLVGRIIITRLEPHVIFIPLWFTVCKYRGQCRSTVNEQSKDNGTTICLPKAMKTSKK